MKYILAAMTLGFLLTGFFYDNRAQSAIHQIYAALYFIMAVLSFGFASVCEALKDKEEE